MADDELRAICAAEHRRLVGLIALQVGDIHIAEELAQDVLVALCRTWPRVDRPAAWLTRVALNNANSWLRRRYAERRALRRHGPSPDVAPASTAGEADHVRRAVAALPRRQREVIAYRFYEQYSVAETATAMGCAEGTVKSLTHHATTALQSVLDPEELAHV